MAETPQSLLQKVIQKRNDDLDDVDGDFVVVEAINEKLAQLHQAIMEALMAKGFEEDAATKAAHELLQLDPEYTELIGGTFDEADVEAMRQRLLRHLNEPLLEAFKKEIREKFEGILEEILVLEV